MRRRGVDVGAPADLLDPIEPLKLRGVHHGDEESVDVDLAVHPVVDRLRLAKARDVVELAAQAMQRRVGRVRVVGLREADVQAVSIKGRRRATEALAEAVVAVASALGGRLVVLIRLAALPRRDVLDVVHIARGASGCRWVQ